VRAELPPKSDLSAADERLDTEAAFRRFVARVSPRALRWLGWWRVPAPDRDDVLQDVLVATYKRRASFDPARGRYEDWAYTYVGLHVQNYRRVQGRRNRRVALAPGDLPDVVSTAPNAEEGIMLRRLLYKCLEELPEDLAAILLARDVDEINVATIATAHGISKSTAYERYKEARQRVQDAFDRELGAQRAHGVAVLPITFDQLIASDRGIPNAPSATMRRVMKQLDRWMAEDHANGALGDDGAHAPADPGVRVSGVRRLGPSALRAILGPRALPALTFAVGAAGGAAAMHAIDLRASQNDTAPSASAQAASAPTLAVLTSDPVPSGAPAPSTPRSSGSSAELRADAGAAASEHDDPKDTAEFDRASAAYNSGLYTDAIKTLENHARQFPKSSHAPMRDRLLTLALIGAGRTSEARQRIERLRRTNPNSQLLKEFDKALPPDNRP